MKTFLTIIFSFILSFGISYTLVAEAANPVTFPINGGTGSTTLSGILIGNGTSPVNSLTIGSNLTLTGTTLSASGSGGGGAGTVGTSTVPAIGSLAYWTSNGYPSLLGQVSTTTASCSGSASCSSFTVIGSTPVTISASGGGTNFWTSSGGNIYNNTGARVQFPAFDATSTSATSTITNALTIAGTAVKNGYLLIEGDNQQAPVYGTGLPTDQIDAGGNANGTRSIDAYNNSTGACAQSGFVANGDIPTLSQDFTSLFNTNSGYTGIGCTDFTDPIGVNPLSTYLFEPTWDEDFVLGTTTKTVAGVPIGFKWLTASGATQAMVLTNQGNLGIGTTSPGAVLDVTSTTTTPTQPLIQASTNGTPVFSVSSSTIGGLSIGSSTPWGYVSINPSAIGTEPSFVIGSSTSMNFVVTNGGNIGIGTSSPSATFVEVGASTTAGTIEASTTGMTAIFAGLENTVTRLFFLIDQWGFPWSSGDQGTLSSCGTSPSFLGSANDSHFVIQVGSVAATGCTYTFAHPKPTPPSCTLTERTGSVTNAFSYTISTTSVVITQIGLTGDLIDANCSGTL